MNPPALMFGATSVSREEIEGKRVLEVGARDVDGSLAPVLKHWGRPAEYIGADIQAGPGVDVLCGVGELLDREARRGSTSSSPPK